MPELARQRADGVIDRSKTRDTPCFPLAAKGRLGVWNSHRGNHLGQRSCASAKTGRTYGRKRSDQSTAKITLRGGGRPHMESSDSFNPLKRRQSATSRHANHTRGLRLAVQVIGSILGLAGTLRAGLTNSGRGAGVGCKDQGVNVLATRKPLSLYRLPGTLLSRPAARSLPG
jgi:hypothetical protein